MKWIGAHIWDWITRFRNDVYLENVREIVQDHVVGIDAEGKLFKQDAYSGDITGVTAGDGLTDGGTSGTVTLNVGAGTGIDVAADAVSVDVSDFMANGSDNRVVTATGSDAMNAETNFTFDGTDLLLDSTGSLGTYGSNVLHLKNSNASVGGPGIRFQKIGKTGADADLIGQINFQALNDADELTTFAQLQAKIGDASDGAETGQLILGANTTLVGNLTGQASTVATIAGLAPNTATTAASQPNITTLAGVFTGSANQLLTDDGDGTVTSEASLSYDSNILTIGADDTTTFQVNRKAHTDNHGGKLYIQSGYAGGTDKNGGDLLLIAGRGTGTGVGGSIYFQSSSAGGSSNDVGNGLANIAEIDNVGNLQIDGGLTTGSTSAINSSGLIQVANQSNITGVGTISSGTWQGTAIASDYLDSDTAHLSIAQTFTGEKTFERKVILDGDKNITPSSDGVVMHIDAMDMTDNVTSASGTATTFSHVVFENPRLMATNSSVTTTNASTVFIKGAPVASTNQTITNAYALHVAGGKSYFGGDVSLVGNILPGITYVKILPSDFVPDDVGRPAMIDDTGSGRWLESHGTAKLFAYVDIPVGFKATHVDIYGSATSAVTVYEADVNSKTVTSKGTGNIGTQINITDVNSDATNYILIELAQASGEEVYGGKLTIAKI